MPDADAHPDFLLTRGSDSLYVEAVTVFSGIRSEGRHAARESAVLDAVEAVADPRFMLNFDFERVGRSRPALSSITKRITGWLAGLEPEAVEHDASIGAAYPTTRLCFGEWEFILEAIPVTGGRRSKERHSMIGIGPVLVGSVDDVPKMRGALLRKRRRHGGLDRPLLIAGLSTSTFLEDRDIETILLGSYRDILSNSPAGPRARVRQADGFFERASMSRALLSRITGTPQV